MSRAAAASQNKETGGRAADSGQLTVGQVIKVIKVIKGNSSSSGNGNINGHGIGGRRELNLIKHQGPSGYI